MEFCQLLWLEKLDLWQEVHMVHSSLDMPRSTLTLATVMSPASYLPFFLPDTLEGLPWGLQLLLQVPSL